MFAIAGGVPATSAVAQDTSTTDTSPQYTVTIPGPSSTPAPVTHPSSGSAPAAAAVPAAAPAPAPALPTHLASTGADPLLVILGGLGVIALSLLARRVILRRIEDA